VKRGLVYQIDSLLMPPSLGQLDSQVLGQSYVPTDSGASLPDSISSDILPEVNAALQAAGVNMTELIQESEEGFSMFSTAVLLFGSPTLSIGALTLFLPSQDAFADLSNEYATDISDPAFSLHLLALLAFHAAEGSKDSQDLLQLGDIEMVAGGTIGVFGSSDIIFLSSTAQRPAQITLSLEVETVGVVHLIDRMLLPPWTKYSEHITLMEKVEEVVGSTYSLFLSLAAGIGLDVVLQTEAFHQATIIAPDNSAFTPQLVAYLLIESNLVLATEIIFYHIIPQPISYLSFGESESTLTLQTLHGSSIDLAMVEGDLMVNNSTRLEAFSLVSSGILYRTGTLLIPDHIHDLIPMDLLPQAAEESIPIIPEFEFPITPLPS